MALAGRRDFEEGVLMRRAGFIGCVVLLAAALVMAANPHFIQGPFVSNGGGQLTVSGTIAGLGNQNVTIRLTATATTTCTNKGGNPPPGQTETLSSELSNLRVENGMLTFSISAQASNPCPD